MNELALFAGVGGGLLGTHLLGWRPVAAVEIKAYRREILMRRQRDGLLPVFPIWDEVRTFRGDCWRGRVDVVTAGFPCQPFSVAGKRLAENDFRNGWPSTIRIIREVGPRFALLENVPGLLAHPYFGTVLGELAEGGYDAVYDCFPASAVGAPQRRDRLFVLAYAQGEQNHRRGRRDMDGPQEGWESLHAPHRAGRENVDDAEGGTRQRPPSGAGGHPSFPDEDVGQPAGPGLEGSGDRRGTREPFTRPWPPGPQDRGAWSEIIAVCPEVEPAICGVAYGVAHRVDRLEALGDGQVPAVVVRAWETLIKRAVKSSLGLA